MDCWQTLGIAATADKREIKRAYARLVKQNNPEDRPKEYQEIREAYDRALVLADYLLEGELETQGDQGGEHSSQSLPVERAITNVDPVPAGPESALNETTTAAWVRLRRASEEAIDTALVELVVLLRRDVTEAIACCRSKLETDAFQALDVRYDFEGRLLETLLENDLLPFSFLKYLAEEFQWDVDTNRHGRMIIDHFDDARFSDAFLEVAHRYLTHLIRHELRHYVQGSYPKLPAERFEQLDAALFADDRETELPEFCRDKKNRKLVETAYFFLANNRYVPPYISILPQGPLDWLVRSGIARSRTSKVSKADGGKRSFPFWLVVIIVVSVIRLIAGISSSNGPEQSNAVPEIYSFAVERMQRIEALRRDANDNVAQAQYELALEYLNLVSNPILTTDRVKAMDLLRSAANQGHLPAQERLGILYYTDARVQDYRLAIDMLTPAADRDRPDAVFWLSMAFLEGKGVERDTIKADQLLDRSIELGSAEGMRIKGLLLIYGTGTKKDASKGVEYLRKATDKGNLNAAYQLAREYLSGSQLSIDYEAARKLMEFLVSKEVPIAKFWMSQFYEKGLGVPQNSAEGGRLLSAAREGSAPLVVNDFAWQLATNRNKAVRNGALAVALMEDVLADPKNVNAQWLDTLAAAYAEVGEFSKAIQSQQRAIDLMTGDKVSPDIRGGFDTRLKRYQAKQSYTED